MSNLDKYTVEELDRENKELKAKNVELVRQLAIRDDLSCQTCKGVGSVLIAIDDGIDCPECAEYESNLKADAIDEIIKEKACSASIDGIATSIIDVDGAAEYSDKLRAGE